jgi:hypothetical protein
LLLASDVAGLEADNVARGIHAGGQAVGRRAKLRVPVRGRLLPEAGRVPQLQLSCQPLTALGQLVTDGARQRQGSGVLGAALLPGEVLEYMVGRWRAQGARSPRAAKDCLNPRRQLRQPKRLGHVVVGPEFEAPKLCRFVRPARHHNDRHVRLQSDILEHVQAVTVGETEIEEHEIRSVASDPLQCLLRVLRLQDDQVLLFQIQPQ